MAKKKELVLTEEDVKDVLDRVNILFEELTDYAHHYRQETLSNWYGDGEREFAREIDNHLEQLGYTKDMIEWYLTGKKGEEDYED